MEKLKQALKESFGVELKGNEKVTFEHNYCGHHIVDVSVYDKSAGEICTFLAYDTLRGCFPY